MAGKDSPGPQHGSFASIALTIVCAAISGATMGGVVAVQTSQQVSLPDAIRTFIHLGLANLPVSIAASNLRELKIPGISTLQIPAFVDPHSFSQPALSSARVVTEIEQRQVSALLSAKAAAEAAAQAAAETKRLTFAVPPAFQGKLLNEENLKSAAPVIALTLDDGPSPGTTEQVLDILKQEGVKATFFWLGKAVQNSPELARRVLNEGHAIGNHTWHHWYNQMNQAEAASEIDNTAKIIYEATGARTSLFRPPGGFLHNGVADYALSQNYAVVLWSVTSADTDPVGDTQAFVNNVLIGARPGAIVLMHDGGGDRSKTVAALPLIIEGLKQQGYEFVTVPQLLEQQAQ